MLKTDSKMSRCDGASSTSILPHHVALNIIYTKFDGFSRERIEVNCMDNVQSIITSVSDMLMLPCNGISLVFDGMVLESDATPLGLGIIDCDNVGIISRTFLPTDTETQGYEREIILLTKRKAEEISVGLNVVRGEDEEDS